MSSFKLHHTKFYTKHSDAETGKLHCYRCNEILELGAKVPLVKTSSGFRVPEYAEDYNGGVDDNGEMPDGPTSLVYMGSLCALKALGGR